MDERFRLRGSANRAFPRGRTYSLDDITRIAGRNQLTVHDGRGGNRIRRASRLMVRDPSGKEKPTLFVRDYANEDSARKLAADKLLKEQLKLRK